MHYNIAILGAGMIVPDFLESLKKLNNVKPYAILGTEADSEKMSELAHKYNIDQIYFDYNDLLNDSKVDVVYIALPNHLHYDFGKKALEMKKHVAIPNIHYPNYLKIKESLTKLGDVKIVEVNSAKYSSRYNEFKKGVILPAFDPSKDGGALMDMGVYNLHFIVGLFGKPNNIQYFPNMERGVDTSGILIMQYPTFTCTAIAAKDCASPNCLNIMGDKGYISSTSRANLILDFNIRENDKDIVHINTQDRKIPERLSYEMESFMEIIINGEKLRYQELKTQTLNVMEILGELKRRKENE